MASQNASTLETAAAGLFENAFHHAPIGMALVSLEGKFLKVNDAFCRMVGYEPEDMLARDFQSITHADDLEKDMTLVQQVAAGDILNYQMDKRYVRADGKLLWVSLSVSMVRHADGSPNHFISQVVDLTSRIEHEEAALEARRAAEAATQAKSDFIANMSHEIRTPLTTVIGYAGLLQHHPSLDPQAVNYASQVAIASKALLSLVSDVIDLSRIESGEIALNARPTSWQAPVVDTVALVWPHAEAKSLTISVDFREAPDAHVLIDADKTSQILTNLLFNAVKFTKLGAVRVHASHYGDRLLVEIRDTGPGLSEAHQAVLFRRFSRPHQSEEAGAGLGLAISQKLAMAMGGLIEVASHEGEGACFRLILPAPLAAEAPHPSLSNLEASGPRVEVRPRVLVVDDNLSNRRLAALILEDMGFACVMAEDGAAAIRIAEQERFDVILMDVRMAGVDGLAAMRTIRTSNGPSSLATILAFTADPQSDRLLRSGFDGCVSKPFTPASLFNIIHQHLGAQAATARQN